MTGSARIPEYPDKRPLALADRDLLTGCLSALQPLISELTFANLYLFRQVHSYALSTINGSIIVSGTGYDGNTYCLLPLSGDRGTAARQLLDFGGTLYGVDETFLNNELENRGYSVVDDRDNDDYLYLQSDLATLPGRKFHKKNNRINYFSCRHVYTVEPFSEAHRDGAVRLVERWARARNIDNKVSVIAETAATIEAVSLFKEIMLSGVAVLVEGEVAAFALGESLNRNTVVCHFEKADPFMEGAAQLVNREFSRSQPESCIYINREQDLGDSGLRTAKNSYHPVSLVKKFRVSAIASRHQSPQKTKSHVQAE